METEIYTLVSNEDWETKKITPKQGYAIDIISREVEGAVFDGLTRKDAADFISKYIKQYEAYKARNHKIARKYYPHGDEGGSLDNYYDDEFGYCPYG